MDLLCHGFGLGPLLAPLLEVFGRQPIYCMGYFIHAPQRPCEKRHNPRSLPETLAPVLLCRKAAKVRAETEDDKYRALEEFARKPFSGTTQVALIRPFIIISTEPFFSSTYISIPDGMELSSV